MPRMHALINKLFSAVQILSNPLHTKRSSSNLDCSANSADRQSGPGSDTESNRILHHTWSGKMVIRTSGNNTVRPRCAAGPAVLFVSNARVPASMGERQTSAATPARPKKKTAEMLLVRASCKYANFVHARCPGAATGLYTVLA